MLQDIGIYIIRYLYIILQDIFILYYKIYLYYITSILGVGILDIGIYLYYITLDIFMLDIGIYLYYITSILGVGMLQDIGILYRDKIYLYYICY